MQKYYVTVASQKFVMALLAFDLDSGCFGIIDFHKDRFDTTDLMFGHLFLTAETF